MDVPLTAVCFDLGGVLARLAGSWSEALEWAGFGRSDDPALSARVHTFEPYNAHELGELSDEDYFEILRGFLGLKTEEEAFRAHLWVLGLPYSGTLGVVTGCRNAGLRTGCLSNTERHHWERMVGGFYPAISAIEVQAASHLLSARKPDRAIFEAFESTSGFVRESTLFFDDSPVHCAAAAEFGWTASPIDPTGDTAAQMRAALAEHGVHLPPREPTRTGKST